MIGTSQSAVARGGSARGLTPGSTRMPSTMMELKITGVARGFWLPCLEEHMAADRESLLLTRF